LPKLGHRCSSLWRIIANIWNELSGSQRKTDTLVNIDKNMQASSTQEVRNCLSMAVAFTLFGKVAQMGPAGYLNAAIPPKQPWMKLQKLRLL